MGKYSHLKLDEKNHRLFPQTTQQLAIFSKKVLITGTQTGKYTTNQCEWLE